MRTKECKIGETEFVDEKTIDNMAINGINSGLDKEKTKIRNNIYQCKGAKLMKGNVYGIK